MEEPARGLITEHYEVVLLQWNLNRQDTPSLDWRGHKSTYLSLSILRFGYLCNKD